MEEAVGEWICNAVPNGESIKCKKVLLHLTKEGKWDFLKFIAPPATVFILCGSLMSDANPPSVMLFY